VVHSNAVALFQPFKWIRAMVEARSIPPAASSKITILDLIMD